MSWDYTGTLSVRGAAPTERVIERAGIVTTLTREAARRLLDLQSVPSRVGAMVEVAQSRLGAELGPKVDLESVPSYLHALALEQSLHQLPLGAVVNELATQSAQTAQRHLERARQNFDLGNLAEAERFGREAQAALTHATLDTYDRLRLAANEVAAASLLDTVRELGFTTQVASNAQGVHTLWASRGDQHLAARISGANALEVDLAGFEGTTCQSFQQELVNALAQRGFSFTLVDGVLHNRRAGGALITEMARAARERGITPERALLDLDEEHAEDADQRERLRKVLLNRSRSRQRVR